MATKKKIYDAIVIGSGAGGSIAVKELTEKGLEVLLLEAGRDLTKEDFIPSSTPGKFAMGPALLPRLKAILGGQHIQSLRAVYAEGSNKFLTNDRQNPYTMSLSGRFLWIRGRVLGGRLNTYGRVCMRFSDYDFKAKSFDGQGFDWPIEYKDLKPYYDKVEKFIGIIGDKDGIEAIPDGLPSVTPFMTSAELGFKKHVEKNFPGRKVISWRYAVPNLERTPKGIVAAKKTGLLTLKTDAVVSRIIMDSKTDLAEGVEYIDRVTKEKHVVYGKSIMLCASGIESVRILWNSADEKHPNGLGNSKDQLGRYFMDQVPSVTMFNTSLFKGMEKDTVTPADPYYGTTGGVFVPRYVNIGKNKTSEHYRGFSFQGAIQRFDAGGADSPAGGGMMGFGEMLAYPDNRITVSKRVKDHWGIPVPHLHCKPGENEKKMAKAQLRAVREMHESMKNEILFTGSITGLDGGKQMAHLGWFNRMVFRVGFPMSLSIGASIHECGGARMGNSPEDSVTNKNGQLWEAPNVVVADGSAFVSGGSVGLVLTIMALSARGAEFIAKALKGKGF
jgi:choline dehydrogenase-like flavoprotein